MPAFQASTGPSRTSLQISTVITNINQSPPAYCSTEHQSADWPAHKIDCRISKTIKKNTDTSFERINPSDSKSPLSTVLLPLRPSRFELFDQNPNPEEKQFCNSDNPMDRIKPPRKSSQCAKTIYGPCERFLVRARWGGHAPVTVEQRRTLNWNEPSMLDIHMG